MHGVVWSAMPIVFLQCAEDQVLWQRLESTGAMEERLVELVWHDVTLQKAALLRLMEKFDLICEHIPSKHVGGATRLSPSNRGRYVYVWIDRERWILSQLLVLILS